VTQESKDLVFDGHDDPAVPQGFVVVDGDVFPRDRAVHVGRKEVRAELLEGQGRMAGYRFHIDEPVAAPQAEPTSGQGR
jgi:hypothetical protein